MKQDLYWVNCLRAVATFSVILLHVAALSFHQYRDIPDSDWQISNVYHHTVCFGVPVFLMISGALILPKAYGSIRDYLNKRVVRIIYPFIFWSLIYIGRTLLLMYRNDTLTDLSIINIIKFIVLEFRTGAFFHFWYIYMIIGLYLFFPIISKWIKNSKLNEVKYFILIWFITLIAALPAIDTIFPKIDLRYFSGYIGYCVLGYLLIKTPFKDIARVKRIAILLILLSTTTMIVGTAIISGQKGSLYTSLNHPLHPLVVLSAIGIFLLFRYSNFRQDNILSRTILFLSKYSYGIYFVHILIIRGLDCIGGTTLLHPIIGIPLMSITCLAVSSVVIWGLNKFPYGRFFAG